MTKPKTASRLAGTIDRFLTHKRALGHGFREEARLLRTLLRHVEAGRRRDLDAPGFDRWLRGFRHCHPNTRRKCCEVVRRFCLYRRRHDPGCFVPSADAIPRGQPHAPPVIVEPDQIARMLVLASRLPPTSTSPLRAPALRLALVLLYTCGLRLGELVRLTLGDIAEQDTVLQIRESKFHKSRLVPLSASTTRELQAYLRQRRRRAFPHPPRAALFCNRHGGHLHPYSHRGVWGALHQLFVAAGVRDAHGRHPRVHDLRHSFAVQALLRWYRQGADVQSCLPKLALYMGHVSIVSSAYYLHWVPPLQRLASQRFEQCFGHVLQGGAQ